MEKYNINTDLFKRYQPAKKLDIIETFNTNDFLSIKEATVLRMVKEAGDGDYYHKARCRAKTLRIARVGNEWNSSISSIYNNTKGKVYLSVYIQGDDTDTDDSCSLEHFLTNCELVTCGELEEEFSNGYKHTIVAKYDKEQRAKVIKQICIAYVKKKYNI